MAERPTVSAVIPAFNSAGFLPEAIASIRTQTVPVEEIIIVDDGSTDDTEKVVRRLGRDILYLHQENAGPAAARNAGVAVAKGEFIAFLDADDQWTPEKNERQLALFNQNSDLGLVASDMAEVDAAGRMVIPSMLDRHHLLDFFKGLECRSVPDGLAALMRKNFIPTGTVLLKTRVFREAGGFNQGIRYGEDLEMWGRIAARHPIVCMPEVHMLRRRHEQNATSAIALMLFDQVKVMRSVREYGGEALKRQGGDPDRLVANALSDLGYQHFDESRLADARAVFRRSLREKITLRALCYFGACCLPLSWVKGLRQFKSGVQLRGT